MPIDRMCMTAVFVGIGLTSVGSAYYHLEPGNERLFWDRLPMLLTFASLLGMLVAERVSPKTGAWFLAMLPVLGAGSLIYSQQTERVAGGPALLLPDRRGNARECSARGADVPLAVPGDAVG